MTDSIDENTTLRVCFAPAANTLLDKLILMS